MYLFKKLEGDVLIELGQKIKYLRKRKKMSQGVLAESIGISRKLMVDIEAGRGTSLLVFIKILNQFNKTEALLNLLETSMVSPKKMFEIENP